MQKPVTEKKKYFVVRERAVPEVLLKVVEAAMLERSENRHFIIVRISERSPSEQVC